jgi:hypothetical protein
LPVRPLSLLRTAPPEASGSGEVVDAEEMEERVDISHRSLRQRRLAARVQSLHPIGPEADAVGPVAHDAHSPSVSPSAPYSRRLRLRRHGGAAPHAAASTRFGAWCALQRATWRRSRTRAVGLRRPC